ncbi:hypothetical protein UP12_18825 [Bacillus pumilus]|nr:hypothetical protein UP12_18825 [Bacillus pumilus]
MTLLVLQHHSQRSTNFYTGDNSTNNMSIDVDQAISVFNSKLEKVRKYFGDIKHWDDWYSLSIVHVCIDCKPNFYKL